MNTRKVATQLSDSGRQALLEFLARVLSDKALRHLTAPWENDITFDINKCMAGHLEIGHLYTDTGNPAIKIFDGDEVVLEDVEEEDDD